VAEFQEVMRQWRRMCKEYTTDDESCCDGCPVINFREHGCGAIFEMEDSTDWQRYSDTIMAWAAERPEPVYPTWYEYLFNVTRGENKWPVDDHEFCQWLDTTPIPADIAQKLGIEPKEG
jgi:hypothetical protein